MTEEKTAEVTIIRRHELVMKPSIEEEIKVTVTTFLYGDHPPLRIQIPVDEWSEAGEEEAIAEKIKALPEFTRETKTIKLGEG